MVCCYGVYETDGVGRVVVGDVGGKDGEVEGFGCGGGFGRGGLDGLAREEREEEKGGRGRWEKEKVIMDGMALFADRNWGFTSLEYMYSISYIGN